MKMEIKHFFGVLMALVLLVGVSAVAIGAVKPVGSMDSSGDVPAFDSGSGGKNTHDVAVTGLTVPGRVSALDYFDAVVFVKNNGKSSEKVDLTITPKVVVSKNRDCPNYKSFIVSFDLKAGESRQVVNSFNLDCVGWFAIEAKASIAADDFTDNNIDLRALETVSVDHDVKVSVNPLPSTLVPGAAVSPVVILTNLGNDLASVFLTTNWRFPLPCVSSLTMQNFSLKPGEIKTVEFVSTKLGCEGISIFTANAAVTDEDGVDELPENNVFSDAVSVQEKKGAHDVGVQITSAPTKVRVNEKFNTSITITNYGNYTETLDYFTSLVPSGVCQDGAGTVNQEITLGPKEKFSESYGFALDCADTYTYEANVKLVNETDDVTKNNLASKKIIVYENPTPTPTRSNAGGAAPQQSVGGGVLDSINGFINSLLGK